MKTLRLFRNIAVLFILVVAVVTSKPGLRLSHAASQKTICIYPGKNGFNCNFDSTGNCYETKCVAGQPCSNGGCIAPAPPPICKNKCF